MMLVRGEGWKEVKVGRRLRGAGAAGYGTPK